MTFELFMGICYGVMALIWVIIWIINMKTIPNDTEDLRECRRSMGIAYLMIIILCLGKAVDYIWVR